MRLSVHYTTHYRYSEPTRRVIQLLRLTPLSVDGQTVLDWRIDVDCDVRMRERRDGYGNVIQMLYIDAPVTSLKVSVAGQVLTENRAGVVTGIPGDLPHQIFTRVTPLTHCAVPLSAFALSLDEQGGTTLDTLHWLAERIRTRMRFDTGGTEIDTSAEEAFAAGHGVCQDFAHIFIAVARCLDIPARYVSGHLFRRDGAMVQEAAHAWAEAWVEDLGWVAFDPTNGICTDDAYIRVACGLDYRDAAPFVGARSGGGTEELSVEVQVRQAQTQSQN